MPAPEVATSATEETARTQNDTNSAVSDNDIESILAQPLADLEDQGTTPDASEATEEDEPIDSSEGAEPDGQPSSPEEETDSPEAADAETERPLAYDRLLPVEQFDRDEEISERLRAAAAKRWSIPEEALNEQWAQDLIRDKINSDIEIKNNRFDRELAQIEEKAQQDEPGSKQEQTDHPEAPGMDAILEQMGNFVKPLVTNEGSKAYAESTGRAWSELSDAQESGDEKRIAEAQRSLTESQMRFAALAAASVLEKMLPTAVDGRIQSYSQGRQQAEAQLEGAINSLSEDPRYADVTDLAADGKLDAVAEEFPELFEKQFKDASGNPLPAEQNLREQIRRAITIIRGQNYKPVDETVNEALKTGEKMAEQRQKQRRIGKGLGSGRASGAFGSKGSSDQDFMDSMVTAFKEQNPL